MKKTRKPASLKAGDKAVIIAPAGKVPYHELLPGASYMQEQWGLKVTIAESLKFSKEPYFSADDATRLAELQEALDHPDYKAIFAARGGYGCTRIIDDVDFTQFKKNPKWLIGFSDITALHGHLGQLGVQSIHGPMPRTLATTNTLESVESLRSLLFDKETLLQTHNQTNLRCGWVKAPIVGGNLCLLAGGLGTASEIQTEGKILLIEDIGEKLYAVDRMLVQLKRAGKLQNLAGLIVGHFSDCPELDFGKNLETIVLDHFPAHIPISMGFDVGHEDANLAIPLGRAVDFEVLPNQTVILAR